MRLIDADKLKEKLQEQQKYGSTADSRGRAKAIVEVIHAPTVEVESTDKTAVFQPFDKSDFDYLAKHGMPIFKCTCSECGDMCFGDENFCSGCGAKIKWDEKRN